MSEWPKTMVAEYFDEGGVEAGYSTEDYEVEFDERVEVVPADLARDLFAALKGQIEESSDFIYPDALEACERYEREVSTPPKRSEGAQP